jgi:hypothetical protein
MQHYARCDTHYLLYCYDRLRQQLAATPSVPPSLAVPLPPHGPQVGCPVPPAMLWTEQQLSECAWHAGASSPMPWSSIHCWSPMQQSHAFTLAG